MTKIELQAKVLLTDIDHPDSKEKRPEIVLKTLSAMCSDILNALNVSYNDKLKSVLKEYGIGFNKKSNRFQ